MPIIDLHQNNDIQQIKAKVCVIGSGPGGGIVAGQLAKQGIDVALIEAGGEVLNAENDFIDPDGFFERERGPHFNWSKQLGGSSHLWAGRSSPFEEIDFEKRSWVPDSGWPISHQEIEPFYAQASEIMGLAGYEYFSDMPEKSTLSEQIQDTGTIQSKCFQWATKPFNVGEYLHDAVQHNPSLRIYLNAPVRKLIEAENGKTIKEIEIFTASKHSIFVQADIFVLATGGIETPRLLLNSTERNSKGIGNEYDVVGRYFSTHPKANIAALILNKPLSTNDPYFIDSTLNDAHYRLGVGLSEKLQRKHKLLNHYFKLAPLLEHKANQAFEMITRSKVIKNDLIDSSKVVQGFLPGLGKLAYEAIGRVAGFQPKAQKFIMRAFLDQYPNKDNRVRLSSAQKDDGTFKADIHWRYSDDDRQSVLNFLNIMDQTLQEHQIGHIEYSKLKEKEDWKIWSIHSHFMGGTRMGSDKKTSVTDKNAKLHDIENLYISGPSLFPTYSFANPFLTIVSLSLRLSETLKTKL